MNWTTAQNQRYSAPSIEIAHNVNPEFLSLAASQIIREKNSRINTCQGHSSQTVFKNPGCFITQTQTSESRPLTSTTNMGNTKPSFNKQSAQSEGKNYGDSQTKRLDQSKYERLHKDLVDNEKNRGKDGIGSNKSNLTTVSSYSFLIPFVKSDNKNLEHEYEKSISNSNRMANDIGEIKNICRNLSAGLKKSSLANNENVNPAIGQVKPRIHSSQPKKCETVNNFDKLKFDWQKRKPHYQSDSLNIQQMHFGKDPNSTVGRREHIGTKSQPSFFQKKKLANDANLVNEDENFENNIGKSIDNDDQTSNEVNFKDNDENEFDIDEGIKLYYALSKEDRTKLFRNYQKKHNTYNNQGKEIDFEEEEHPEDNIWAKTADNKKNVSWRSFINETLMSRNEGNRYKPDRIRRFSKGVNAFDSLRKYPLKMVNDKLLDQQVVIVDKTLKGKIDGSTQLKNGYWVEKDKDKNYISELRTSQKLQPNKFFKELKDRIDTNENISSRGKSGKENQLTGLDKYQLENLENQLIQKRQSKRVRELSKETNEVLDKLICSNNIDISKSPKRPILSYEDDEYCMHEIPNKPSNFGEYVECKELDNEDSQIESDDRKLLTIDIPQVQSNLQSPAQSAVKTDKVKDSANKDKISLKKSGDLSASNSRPSITLRPYSRYTNASNSKQYKKMDMFKMIPNYSKRRYSGHSIRIVNEDEDDKKDRADDSYSRGKCNYSSIAYSFVSNDRPVGKQQKILLNDNDYNELLHVDKAQLQRKSTKTNYLNKYETFRQKSVLNKFVRPSTSYRPSTMSATGQTQPRNFAAIHYPKNSTKKQGCHDDSRYHKPKKDKYGNQIDPKTYKDPKPDMLSIHHNRFIDKSEKLKNLNDMNNQKLDGYREEELNRDKRLKLLSLGNTLKVSYLTGNFVDEAGDKMEADNDLLIPLPPKRSNNQFYPHSNRVQNQQPIPKDHYEKTMNRIQKNSSSRKIEIRRLGTDNFNGYMKGKEKRGAAQGMLGQLDGTGNLVTVGGRARGMSCDSGENVVGRRRSSLLENIQKGIRK